MIARTVRAVAITATIFICAAIYWDIFRPWWHSDPAKAPEVVIAEADAKCYRVLAWDDAYSEDELVYVVFAAMNLSRELKMQPCDIYKKALTIRAPTQSLNPLLRAFGRKVAIVDAWAEQFTGTSAWQARAGQVVEKILKDPSPFVAQYPWLACVTRYIRSHNRALAWTDKNAMRSEMRLAYKSPLGGEFFCPK